MAAAIDSTPAPIIPFPIDRARPPVPSGERFDDWTRARNTALAAQIFGSTPGEATDMVRATILEGGADAIATMLEQLRSSIGVMRGAVAELVAADRLISSAADFVLAEAGL